MAKISLCGWCAGAAVSTEPIRAHQRCKSTDALPCACALAGHQLTEETAEYMAAFCHTSVEHIWHKLGSLDLSKSPEPSVKATETLVCTSCGESFDRVIKRGRKPRLCPECAEKDQPETSSGARVDFVTSRGENINLRKGIL